MLWDAPGGWGTWIAVIAEIARHCRDRKGKKRTAETLRSPNQKGKI